MAQNAAAAESLFRDFALRHSFVLERLDDPNMELLMRVPKQPGLSFELTLGLQNVDELNIGLEKFRSYFFPRSKWKVVTGLLDGLATGDCRLAVHTQLGGVVKRVLEQHSNGTWIPAYTAVSRLKIPFLGTKTSYLQNEDVRRQRDE